MPALIERIKTLCKRPEKKSPPVVMGAWSIGIYTGTSPLDLQPGEGIENPVLRASDVTDVPANFVADPFMIRSECAWHLFFEVDTIRREGNIGKIGMASSPDGLSWKYEKIVLEAPFHLSYPYVFAWRDDYFMIPETRADRSIRLYRAVDFPFRWQLEKTLIKGRRFADASLVRFQDRWWLFTDSGNSTLRLYSSKDLTGRWSEHPRSPIIRKNPSIARPGGRVTTVDGQPLRFAQDCLPRYGSRVWAFRVGELTPTAYREQKYPAPVIEASGRGWNRHGMHTVDPHRLDDGRWIACVDGFGDEDSP